MKCPAPHSGQAVKEFVVNPDPPLRGEGQMSPVGLIDGLVEARNGLTECIRLDVMDAPQKILRVAELKPAAQFAQRLDLGVRAAPGG
jgi:hypothetical protein